jgi:hypothetical protein
MRIISPFHDFYDCVQRYNQDRELVYVRNPQKVEMPYDEYPFREPNRYTNIFNIYSYHVGFCGKLYSILEVDIWKPYLQKYHGKFCFNIYDVDNFVDANFKQKDKNKYYTKYSRGNIQTHFSWVEENCHRYQKYFDQYNCPVFIGHLGKEYSNKGSIVYNCRLQDVEFYRVFDPYQAYQEIRMYLGNIAWPNKPIPHVSDEDLITAKGFNKWSFRKCPQNR